jgi:hypothetical protein
MEEVMKGSRRAYFSIVAVSRCCREEIPMNEDRMLIDSNELSSRLSVPKGALRNWCYLRRSAFIKAGRSLLFDADEVILSLPYSGRAQEKEV